MVPHSFRRTRITGAKLNGRNLSEIGAGPLWDVATRSLGAERDGIQLAHSSRASFEATRIILRQVCVDGRLGECRVLWVGAGRGGRASGHCLSCRPRRQREVRVERKLATDGWRAVWSLSRTDQDEASVTHLPIAFGSGGWGHDNWTAVAVMTGAPPSELAPRDRPAPRRCDCVQPGPVAECWIGVQPPLGCSV